MKSKNNGWIWGSFIAVLAGCGTLHHGSSGSLTISSQPLSQRVPPGTDVEFTVGATGQPPIRYYWRVNGVELRGHSGSISSAGKITLRVPRARSENGGAYELVLEDRTGATNSQLATLAVEEGDAAALADEFAKRAVTTKANGLLYSSNVGATKQPGEPQHAGVAGGASVWLAWRAPTAGIASFSTAGSALDTLLGVYTGNNVAELRLVTSDDDRGPNYTSALRFTARAGVEYQIAVDGFAGAANPLVLKWNLEPTAQSVPHILQPPKSIAARTNGLAVFHVAAEGENLSYRWKFNGRIIRGATNSTLTISNVQLRNVGPYTVVVRAAGGREVESVPALLDLGPQSDARLEDKVEVLFTATNDWPAFPLQGKPVALGHSHPLLASTTTPPLSLAAGSIQLVTATNGLTQSAEPTCCGKSIVGTLYVDVRPQQSGVLTLDTFASAPVDPVLKLRKPTDLVNPLCSDNTNGTMQSKISLNVTNGQIYRVTIGKKQGSPAGLMKLNMVLE